MQLNAKYLGLESCIPNVLLTHGYWIGFCSKNHSRLCTGYCSDGFCSYHSRDKVSGDNSHIRQQVLLLHHRIVYVEKLCIECSM